MQNVANKRKEYDSRIINNSLYISVTEEQRMVDILVLSSNIRKEKHKEEQHGTNKKLVDILRMNKTLRFKTGRLGRLFYF